MHFGGVPGTVLGGNARALVRLTFDSFAALERHLTTWMAPADELIHGTTHEVPRVRFDRDERAALRPLPIRALPPAPPQSHADDSGGKLPTATEEEGRLAG